MPMKVWHHPFVDGIPIIEVRVVEEGNNQAIKRLVRLTIDDGRDDRIAFDAEA